MLRKYRGNCCVSGPLYHYISATNSSGWSHYPNLLGSHGQHSKPNLDIYSTYVLMESASHCPHPSLAPVVTKRIRIVSSSQVLSSCLIKMNNINIIMWLSISNAIHYQQRQVFHSRLRWFWLRSTWLPKCLHAVDPLWSFNILGSLPKS